MLIFVIFYFLLIRPQQKRAKQHKNMVAELSKGDEIVTNGGTLGKTLAGEPTEVSYPAMPVTIKTPACPVVVAPPAQGADGEWAIEQDGNSVKALFRNAAGELLGFALTGDATKEKMALQKELPAIMA